jgi:Zn-dependent protease with chaperone function/Flp pilus assembly protein TadD
MTSTRRSPSTPRQAYARLGRLEYFRRKGDLGSADAELRQIEWSREALFGNKGGERGSGGRFAGVAVTPSGAWIVVLAVWVVAAICNITVGWGQKVEGSGSLGRLLWVAAGLGVIEVLPLAVWATFAMMQNGARDQILIALGMTFISLVLALRYLGPPVRLRGTREKLPRVDDPQFLARVAELAGKMHVPVPIVRLWPSLTSSQQALAFAGTIQAPQLVVTDGILRRLAPAERDAIVAHELAHIANGSLWSLAAVVPVSCAVATAASLFLPQSFVWPLGFAFLVGLKRLVSRPYEYDCDRCAARAIGFRETTAALAKIHAVHPIRNSGLLSLLVYATTTHPSREMRLAALRDAAPDADRPEIELSAATIRWQRRATAAALVTWIAALSGTLAAALWRPQLWWLSVPLWTVALTPIALLVLAQRRQVSLARKRMGRSRVWIVGFVLGMPIALSVGVLNAFPEWTDRMPLLRTIPGAVAASMGLCWLVWLLWTHSRRRLRRDVVLAFQVHDFRRALALAESQPRVVARDHVLRYNMALARAVCGDRAAAIAELEQLWRDRPRFPMTALALGQLLLDAERPGQALEVARQVAESLPGDPTPPFLESAALRRLGRLDEAQAACDRALDMEPEDGTVLALHAALAHDRGDLHRAAESIAKALAFAPGAGYVMAVRAELALQVQPLEKARAAVEEAVEAVRTNPFAFLASDVMRLRQSLATHEDSATIIQATDPVPQETSAASSHCRQSAK